MAEKNSPIISPKGLARIPPESELVVDADEEVFYIYTQLAGETRESSEPLGLGSVDSKSPDLTISFTIGPPDPISRGLPPSPQRSGKDRRYRNKVSVKPSEEVAVEMVLHQDPGSLRSRDGDTGSVLWRASVTLARCLLQEHHFPTAAPLLQPQILQTAKVLELGAGIGLLACTVPPITGHYTATDMEALVPLLRRNVNHTFSPEQTVRVTVTDLDWVQLQETNPSRRKNVFALDDDNPFDLIICCDCIYNTSLVPPLITTINYCASKNTVVLIAAELRDEDVLREFLAKWLEGGEWEIWRLPVTTLDVRTIAWVGWKRVLG